MSIKYEKDGTYIGRNGNDYYLFFIEGIDEDMTFKEYDQFIADYSMTGTPLNRGFYPQQQIRLSMIDDAEHIGHIFEDVNEDTGHWLGWGGLDWWAILTHFREVDPSSIWGYTEVIKEEFETQRPTK